MVLVKGESRYYARWQPDCLYPVNAYVLTTTGVYQNVSGFPSYAQNPEQNQHVWNLAISLEEPLDAVQQILRVRQDGMTTIPAGTALHLTGDSNIVEIAGTNHAHGIALNNINPGSEGADMLIAGVYIHTTTDTSDVTLGDAVLINNNELTLEAMGGRRIVGYVKEVLSPTTLLLDLNLWTFQEQRVETTSTPNGSRPTYIIRNPRILNHLGQQSTEISNLSSQISTTPATLLGLNMIEPGWYTCQIDFQLTARREFSGSSIGPNKNQAHTELTLQIDITTNINGTMQSHTIARIPTSNSTSPDVYENLIVLQKSQPNHFRSFLCTRFISNYNLGSDVGLRYFAPVDDRWLVRPSSLKIVLTPSTHESEL